MKNSNNAWVRGYKRAFIIAQDKKFAPKGQSKEILEEAKKRPEDRLYNLDCAQYREKFERLCTED